MCVTGLVVADTATAFATFGEVIILLLIQMGGLGYMTEDAALQTFLVQPAKWRHGLRRGYKLTDWQTRHEVTHPVLMIRTDYGLSYRADGDGKTLLPRAFGFTF